MSRSGRDSPSSAQPQAVPISSSPGVGSFRGRSYGTSVPRADATARLASPVPSNQQRQRTASGDYGSGTLTPLAGAGATGSYVPGPGVSALAAALSQSFGTSPSRHGTP